MEYEDQQNTSQFSRIVSGNPVIETRTINGSPASASPNQYRRPQIISHSVISSNGEPRLIGSKDRGHLNSHSEKIHISMDNPRQSTMSQQQQPPMGIIRVDQPVHPNGGGRVRPPTLLPKTNRIDFTNVPKSVLRPPQHPVCGQQSLVSARTTIAVPRVAIPTSKVALPVINRVADRFTYSIKPATTPVVTQPAPAMAPNPIDNNEFALQHTSQQQQQNGTRVATSPATEDYIRLVYYPEEGAAVPQMTIKEGVIESRVVAQNPSDANDLSNTLYSPESTLVDVIDELEDKGDDDEVYEDEDDDEEFDEEQDEFILEEGGGEFSDSSPLEGSEDMTESDEASAAIRELMAVPEKPPAPKAEVQPLEWHIKRTMVRLGNVATAYADEEVHSGVVELEIEKGRILSQTPCAGTDNLIAVMNRMECIPSLEHDMNYINRRSPKAWKPAPRNARLHSDGEAASNQPQEPSVDQQRPLSQAATPEKQGIKRKWDSMDFDLELDTNGQYKRNKSMNLTCDESLVGASSDELSDTERSGATAEAVLIPVPSSPALKLEVALVNGTRQMREELFEIKTEPVDVDELPVMLEGKQMFNSEPNTLEATKAKVRECFRPSEMGPEPNGFDFLYWKSNIGLLFGSNLSFFVNELGIMDLKKTKPSKAAEKRNQQLAKAEARRLSMPEPVVAVKEADGSNVDDVEKKPVKEVKDTFWQKYMEEKGSYAAPEYLFKHTQDEDHNLKLGDTVEIINPINICHMAMGTVTEVLGGRVAISLRNKQTYYFNRNSWMIFPVGFAAALNIPMDGERKKGTDYVNNEIIARAKNSRESPFKVNWGVEAFDWAERGKLRPATVTRIICNRLLIVFDEDVDVQSREKRKDGVPKTSFWCTDDSPLIRPVNYHLGGIKPFYSCNPDFNWRVHLEGKRRRAAPAKCFRTRKALPFKVGMQLEAVDRINPQVMRPATVKAISEYEIQIQYDGFPDERDQSFNVWAFDDSEDLFPVQWCSRNGHVLAMSTAKTHCQRKFCSDVGHRNTWRLFHASEDACPYRMPDYMHNFHRDPVLAARFTRLPKLHQNRITEKVDLRDDIISALQEKVRRQAELLNGFHAVKDYGPRYRQTSELWNKQTACLPGPIIPSSPLRWTTAAVEQFIDSVPNCACLGSVFVFHEINGEALLSLTERDLIDVMGLKQGVVTKIYNAIVKLRTRVTAEVFQSPRK